MFLSIHFGHITAPFILTLKSVDLLDLPVGIVAHRVLRKPVVVSLLR